MEAQMSQSSGGAPGWQLEGNAPLAYDTHIVDVFLQDYSRRLVEVAAIKAGDRVLDVACGTGVVTQLVANKIGSAGQVVGFDLNAGMLARARASRETAAAIEWRVGNATDMPFADATFDCVICQHGLQFIPDKAAAVSEMHRVLADRGRIVISVWRSIEHCPWQAAMLMQLSVIWEVNRLRKSDQHSALVTLTSYNKSLLPRDFETSKFESTARRFDTHQ
jgi:ubiquinone/menaquinone biosynthesis C-methylase UbiE